ncbi:MAG: hypothetical protein GWM87_13680 [Xanthomonadales bacterium]|nr:class I SAM-dependent methyltransferase [Xanthomonadales bacterium]NIX13866.1 hypothetical protein [Xanthomonadales bacterium]
MNQSFTQDRTGKRSQQTLVESVLLPSLQQRRPGRILLISGDPRHAPQLPGLASQYLVNLSAGAGDGAGSMVCNSAALPVQDDSVEIVVLHHVASDGDEPELEEAMRVLSTGGEIYVLGQGSLGLEGRWGRRRNSFPRLRVTRVCRRLREHSIRIEQCLGVGPAGVPVSCERRWQQPALSFADCILIHGRHRAVKPVVTPLRFNRPQTVGVQSAVAENLSREAV